MKRKFNNDVAHLKWKLINQEGLSPEEADKRISEMKNWKKNNQPK